MNFNEMKNNLEKMANDNYETFIKALIGFEKGIEDKKLLDEVYARYMDNDGYTLLSDEIDKTINELSKDDRNVKYENNLEKEVDNTLEEAVNTLKEIEDLKFQIKEKSHDHFHADSFEQSHQIYEDIKELQNQLRKAETYLSNLSVEKKEKYKPEYVNQEEKSFLNLNEVEKEVDNTLKEIKDLKNEIEERKLDHNFADSFEQAAQITKDIKELKEQLAKAETYLVSLSGERKEKYTPEYVNQEEKSFLNVNEVEKEVDNTLKEIKNLKLQINERELDHYYADSFEQAAQITKDIKELKEQLAKAETYLISLSGERKEKYTPEYINQKEKKSTNITEVGLNKNINNDKKIEETKKSERSI